MQRENYRKKDCVKVDQRLHVVDATSSCLHLQLRTIITSMFTDSFNSRSNDNQGTVVLQGLTKMTCVS